MSDHSLVLNHCFIASCLLTYLQQESKNDPETEPYKSKYKARDILMEIRKKLENYDSDSDEKDKGNY